MILPRISLLLTGFAVFGTPISVYGLDTCCLDTVCQYCVPPPEENIGYCKSFKERLPDPDCPVDTECKTIFGCIAAPPIDPDDYPSGFTCCDQPGCSECQLVGQQFEIPCSALDGWLSYYDLQAEQCVDLVDRSVSLPTFILERYINPIELSSSLQNSLEGTFDLPVTVEVTCISTNCPDEPNLRLRRLQSDTDFTYSGSVSLQSAEPNDAAIIAAALSYLSTQGLVHDSGMKDDPHIKTWTGQWFDFHGECDLVLIHATNFEANTPLMVHVRTSLRYFYSYISSAALSIGDTVLEVSSWGEYALDGVSQATLEGGIAGFPIYHSSPNEKQHIFDVVLGPHENITISTFKDLVSVSFHGGTRDHFGDSEGIMGSFDGTLLARDGITVLSQSEEANRIGQEWQVREDEPMLFRTARAPQAPTEQCRLPSTSATTAEHRKLEESISQAAAEEACIHLLTEDQRKACIYDVLAVGDLDIAQAGAY